MIQRIKQWMERYRRWNALRLCKKYGHYYGLTAYRSSSGRQLCTRCGFVSEPDPNLRVLGVGEGDSAERLKRYRQAAGMES
jgi:hypothetical protein